MDYSYGCCSGIGGIYPSSGAKLPTSAYSVSLALAIQIGFWDAGPQAIGEDMHMFCKSMLDTRGNVRPPSPFHFILNEIQIFPGPC